MRADVVLTLAKLEAFDPFAPEHSPERRFCCPLPACDGKPVDAAHRSLAVNLETGAFICHRCTGTGRLAERCDQQAPTRRRAGRGTARRAFALPPRTAATLPDDERWRKRLERISDIGGTPAEAYLVGRGIAPSAIGWSGYCEDWQHWERQNGAWMVCGADRRVVFGLYDVHGEFMALQARAIDPEHLGSRVVTVGSKRHGIYGATRDALSFPAVALTEAPIDALSLATMNVPAVALCGTTAPDWLAGALALKRVYLATDNDSTGAGDRAAANLATQLNLGSRCVRWRPPGGIKDWNQALTTLGMDELRSVLLRSLRSTHQEHAS